VRNLIDPSHKSGPYFIEKESQEKKYPRADK